MSRILAICRSDKKGISKQPIAEGVLKKGEGLIGDAHADCTTHRQISLLAIESIGKMRRPGINLSPGDFAENLTTEGIDLTSLEIGTRIDIGNEVVIEITQIGKECHTGCAISKQVGKCVMPQEGIFARVVHGGPVRVGDSIVLE